MAPPGALPAAAHHMLFAVIAVKVAQSWAIRESSIADSFFDAAGGALAATQDAGERTKVTTSPQEPRAVAEHRARVPKASDAGGGAASRERGEGPSQDSREAAPRKLEAEARPAGADAAIAHEGVGKFFLDAPRRHSEYSSTVNPVQEELEQKCSAFQQCFCMRDVPRMMNNVCGWCESTQTAMLGTPAGPADDQVTCNRWIWSHRECPNLWCDDDITVNFILGILFPPGFYALAWLYATHRYEPLRDARQPVTMQYRRSFENFAKGLTGDRAKLHTEPFQLYFHYEPDITFLIRKLLGTCALQQVLSQALRFGFFMSLFYTALRLLPLVCEQLTFEIVSSTLNEIKELSETLKVAVGFLFSFYALGRVSWWWEVISYSKRMQGRSHDLGLTIGGYTAVKECPQGADASKKECWVEAKWNFFRFLMLSWIFCFRPLSADFGTVTMDEIQATGLMTEDEAEIIRAAEHPRKIPLKWLAVWVEHHIEDNTVRALIMDKVCGLRAAMGALHDAVELRAPMSFEGLMYTLVIAWVTTIPFGRLKELDNRRVLLEENVFIPVFGAMCTCAFYMSMVALLETFKQPFGTSRDALNTDNLVLEMETSVWDYMTAPAPDCFEHILTAERCKLTDRSSPS